MKSDQGRDKRNRSEYFDSDGFLLTAFGRFFCALEFTLTGFLGPDGQLVNAGAICP